MTGHSSALLPGFTASCLDDNAIVQGPSKVTGPTAPIEVASWGQPHNGHSDALFVSRVHRDSRRSIRPDEITRALEDTPSSLTTLLPPFGAAIDENESVTAVADSLGFQPFFHTHAGQLGKAVLSTSAIMAARANWMGLDETSVGVQALLGWQLGQQTVFSGIDKLSPGSVARLDSHGISITRETEPPADPIDLPSAVKQAAALLRMALNAILDDHPDAVLQLTGGLDSRLLLSAIPKSRRRGLRAMTLEVPGSDDAAIASSIAERYGIVHAVHGLTDLSGISPAEAWDAVTTESAKLDAMADPVALAAQRFAERKFEQGTRISGLGGEIARGFYYIGRVRDRAFTRADAEKLASWRMFVNDAVETDLLVPDFLMSARRIANDRVYAALRGGGDEWYRATDTLYSHHRMQRWAGPTDVAVSDLRTVINPMLDYSFVKLAFRLPPQHKANSRFLTLLQVELDDELARIALNGRPAPAALAKPTSWRPALDAARFGRQSARKAYQRLRGKNRPPAGGNLLTEKVVTHLRSNPNLLEPIGSLQFINQDWIAKMLQAQFDPRPSTIALIVNLVVALQEPGQ